MTAPKPRTNPDCTARIHQSAYAADKAGCICPEALTRLEEVQGEAVKRNREAKAERARIREVHKTLTPAPTPMSRAGERVMACPDRACRGLPWQWFFPVNTNGHTVDRDADAVKDVCRRCPVVADCRQYADDVNDDFAILGATTPRDRRAERRQQAGVA